MIEAPSLVSLCLDAIAEQNFLEDCDDFIEDVYGLPSELFDSLVFRLTPLALQNLQQRMPFPLSDDYVPPNVKTGNERKRKRCSIFERKWKLLYEDRWPSFKSWKYSANFLQKEKEVKDMMTDDWQQTYWERHIQNCFDEAAEIALLPSYDGSIGMAEIPDFILNFIGCRGAAKKSTFSYSKFSDHCEHFGSFARCLRLPGALCVPELCHLLRNSRLESLEIQWIKSTEQADGVCELLKQKAETLKSIDLVHCKLSTSFINAICDRLSSKLSVTHGIQHFSIKTSSFGKTDFIPVPAGLESFLSSRRTLSSLKLCDNHLDHNFAKKVIDILLDASSSIKLLDLSENSIAGWISHLKWGLTKKHPPAGISKSLESLRVLILRNCNLEKEDADCLKLVLARMPKLECLDLSDNAIEDDGIKCMIPYFAEMSNKYSPLIELKLGNCDLTSNGVTELFGTLLTWKTPLSSLCIGENNLGSGMGMTIGTFLTKGGIKALDIEDIGFGSSGFQFAQTEISEKIPLVFINISKNRGGIETAKFLSKLIPVAPELSAINAGYNFMPPESLSILFSSWKASKGKLQHLDINGNTMCEQSANASSLLSEFMNNGKCIVELGKPHGLTVPYDDEP